MSLMGTLMLSSMASRASGEQQNDSLSLKTFSENKPTASKTFSPNIGIMWTAISKSGFRVDMVPTIHIFSRKASLPARIVERIDAAEKVFVEADPNDRLDIAKAIKLCQYGPGDDVFKHLSPETRALVIDRVQVYGISMQKVEILKPWAISLLLQDVEKRRADLGTFTSVDAKIIDEARRRGVPVFAFESIEQQFKMFDSFPEAIQDLMLRSYLQQDATPAETNAALTIIENSWVAGDVNQVSNEISSLDPYPPKVGSIVSETTLVKRNRQFVDRILLEAQSPSEAPMLVAVGFNHFTGEHSLLSLLKEHGFRIASN